METVPYCFIEAVLRSDLSERARRLDGVWGELAEAYLERRGTLELRYAPYLRNEWRLYYQMQGFNHIKTRTLSPKVVKEMSRSIAAINLAFTHDLREADGWTSVDPDDGEDDAVVLLLTGLDAPSKHVWLHISHGFRPLGPKCVEMLSRYPRLLRTFTTIRLGTYTEPSYIQLLEDAVATGRVQRISIISSVFHRELVPAVLPTSFWVNYFFSESCRTLHVHFEDLDVPLGVIDRWQKTDPRTLAPNKLFTGIMTTANDMEEQDVDMTTILLSEAEPEVAKIVRLLAPGMSFLSLRYICHPVDPNSRIYVVFREENDCSLLFR
uniref:F-box domain-containing protein n=1 Tax=Steinernema glaseri TaxID=37863 RepID=A0A1I7Z0N1_9BILA